MLDTLQGAAMTAPGNPLSVTTLPSGDRLTLVLGMLALFGVMRINPVSSPPWLKGT